MTVAGPHPRVEQRHLDSGGPAGRSARDGTAGSIQDGRTGGDRDRRRPRHRPGHRPRLRRAGRRRRLRGAHRRRRSRRRPNACGRSAGARWRFRCDVTERDTARGAGGAREGGARPHRPRSSTTPAAGRPCRSSRPTGELRGGCSGSTSTSAFVLTRACAARTCSRATAARSLNISSAAGRIVRSGFVAYGTAKAALSFMTRAARRRVRAQRARQRDRRRRGRDVGAGAVPRPTSCARRWRR